jgi:aspartate aminotransferase-like enzyme
MAAPGLAMVAASERAWAAIETARMPRFYLDLRKARHALAEGETPWTPAIAVAFQVDEGLRLMAAEGQANVFARHEACAAASRAGLAELGFDLFAERAHASTTVTCLNLPQDVDWKTFNAAVKRRNVVLAGGQGKLAGKVFRVGHLGSVTVEEILGAVAALEDVSLEMGRAITPGAGVAAAQRAAVEARGNAVARAAVPA